ncbi:hypothetical protein [Leifsonia soli]|uniref:DUF1453 family protein n=1 Tax=Leifsonia soli TaxID=582665 RepID=A0A852SZ26_9MICO|nr:hypothetical protein [Leifsonia soli]NYD74476.1 hypothetical protein [Leifsonia soli]
MTVQTLGNALLILLLIGWVGYRQLTWRPVVIAKMWRMPGILAVVGAVLLVQQVKPATITPLDLAVVAGEIVLSLAIGAWIGGIAHFRRLPEPVVGKTPSDIAVYESRTGVLGLVLWMVVIAVRVGVDVLAAQAGSHLGAATGIILLVFAANRLARAAVFAARLDRHAALAA